MSSSCVTHFLKTAHSDKSLHLAAKEATFAYHTAIHRQSVKSSDKLLSKFFEPKFTNERTKCESELVNCIAPMIVDELSQELS